MNRRLIPYMGSKWTLAPLIESLLGDHDTYVELFGGSACVLLRKRPSKVEVYNEINSHLVTFFRVVREQPEALVEALRATPYARVEFERAIEALKRSDLDDVEAARCVLVSLWQAIQPTMSLTPGSWGSCVWSKTNCGWNRVLDWRDKVPAVILDAAQRLRRVFIECSDWLYVLRRYDSPRTAFYVDPPYMLTTRTGQRYADEMTTPDHAALLEALKSVQGHVVLSGYDSELYNEALSDWQRIERKAATQGTPRREVIWVKPGAVAYQRALF